MKRGEAVCCIIDYDLFGVNVNGKQGCFIQYSEGNEKYLIRFDCNLEWAELKEGEFELVNRPGYIPKHYREYIKKVQTMKITY